MNMYIKKEKHNKLGVALHTVEELNKKNVKDVPFRNKLVKIKK